MVSFSANDLHYAVLSIGMYRRWCMPEDHRRQDQDQERQPDRAAHQDGYQVPEWERDRSRRHSTCHRVCSPSHRGSHTSSRFDPTSYGRFESAAKAIQRVAGDELAARIHPIWDLTEEGEQKASWRWLGVPNLWYMLGVFCHWCLNDLRANERMCIRQLGDVSVPLQAPCSS